VAATEVRTHDDRDGEVTDEPGANPVATSLPSSLAAHGVADAARTVRRWRPDRQATRDILPIALSVLPFAAVIGVTIAASPVVPVWLGLLSGALLYGGTGQLAMLHLLDAGAAPTAVVATVLVVNGRLAMYGGAIATRFADQPAWFRWLGPHYLVDQTYALVDDRPGLAGRAFRRYWGTAGTVLLVLWMAAMTAGALVADVLPDRSPLDVAAPAVLVALLVPRLRQRGTVRLPAGIAAVVAIAGAGLPFGLGILAGVLAGALASSLVHARSTVGSPS
jgi:predicted branched-subunit amino acid permease